jgi:hypothetical protein
MERVSGSQKFGAEGSGQGTQATEQAKQQGQQLAQQARQQAGELANRGTEQVKSQLANQKHDASQRMVPVQSALRETAQQLRKQGQGNVGQYADKAADQVERFSGYLRETDVDEIVDEVRGFARRRPALFLGTAAALGFFGTRFLKSTSQQAGYGGNGYTAAPLATSNAAVTHGTGEPATALPPGPAEGSSPTTRRTPLAGQFQSERDLTEPPRGV